MGKPIYCPECGRRMVFVAMAGFGCIFHTWQCDCIYRDNPEFVPPEIVGDIVRAREWDDGSIAVDLHKIGSSD